MFHTAEDGSAIVSGIPIPPFVTLQHQQPNVATINYLANYSLRIASERGWLQTVEDMTKATDFYESNDARPLVEQEGYAHKGDDLTFFYAGVDASLAARQPHFHYPPVPSTLLLWSRYYVSHVGNSAYSLYGELHAYVEGKEATTKRLLGHFRVSRVQVSKTGRTACPLPEARRAVIAQCYEGGKAYLTAQVPDALITRLNPRQLLRASGLVEDPSGDLAHIRIVPFEEPAGSPYKTRFSVLYRLRDTDIDFNHHVNQLAMEQLVVNAFRASLRANDAKELSEGEQEKKGAAAAALPSLYPHLLNRNVNALIGDLLVRGLRIDYVKEIPMAHEAVEVFLFPLDEAAVATMTQSEDGARRGELASIGFFSCGVPHVAAATGDEMKSGTAADAQDRYVATVGVLSCYV